ncbi:helix-turn-helix domain-containing protein [Sphingobium sufflavum]|uniref:helix-turn-helix domain-containing protein n=1 Tax=Sphingobium sufflavum TaxID=1129547 RepID=UPI001F19CA72|nr:helix-turn-helix domain-containing protein [Sphingobium sufflavum]MCE7796541.1 helix-turn-helix domain-containing protein [Sphingobium sufflavum]
MTDPEPIFTVPALAERWSVSDTFVYTLLNRGELAGFKLGGKLWRVKQADVMEYEERPA